MKNLVIVLALAALGGCATYYPAPAYYSSRANAAPGQWQTVSVTPVPNGTAAATGSTTVAADGTTTVVQPVYTAPVYVDPYPYYYGPDPYYWWPPVSIGLGFGFSNCCHTFRGGGFHGGFRAGGVRHR